MVWVQTLKFSIIIWYFKTCFLLRKEQLSNVCVLTCLVVYFCRGRLSNAQGLQRDAEGCNSGNLIFSSQLWPFRASLGFSAALPHLCQKEIIVLTAAWIVLGKTMESLGTAVRGAI